MISIFWKSLAGVFVALILWLCLDRHNKDISLLLTFAVCAMIITAALSFLQPITTFLQKIQKLGNIDYNLYAVIIKIVGIGILSEIASLVCKDAGNASLGKALQLVSAVTVLWLSIPIFEEMLSLLEKILGKL